MNFKVLYVYLIAFISFSCTKNSNKNENISNISTQIDSINSVALDQKTISKQPVFLSFSPTMTENEFDNEYKRLSENETIQDGFFQIEINKVRLNFFINKNDESIKLKCYTDGEFKQLKDLIMEFQNNLTKKYKSHENLILPSFSYYDSIENLYYYNDGVFNVKPGIKIKEFKDFGFYNQNYKVFSDSTTSLLLGYTIEEIDLDRRGLLENFGRFIDTKDKDGNRINKKWQPRKIEPYTLTIVLDYFYKEQFEDLISKIKADYYQSIQKQIQEQKNEKEKLQNNLNEF